jgi:DnaJ-class molecular chaperone
MEDCSACSGTGYASMSPRRYCGTCKGAGEFEVYDAEPTAETADNTTGSTA